MDVEMTSSLPSNPVVNSERSLVRRKKKKKIQSQIHGDNLNNNQNQNSAIEWKSESQQHTYSSKLLQALRQVRLNGSQSQTTTPKRGRAVREAADRVLATTGKGRSRWSRAILTNRLKLKFLKKNNITKRQRNVMVVTTGNSRPKKKSKVSIFRLKSKSLPAVNRKVRILGRLVPGCRKEPLPVILEEASDYIPALEMQIRAMSALTELLSVSGGSSSFSSGAAASGGPTDHPGSSRSHPS
ncbi:transcription factor bHLH148-like [Olea europaea subsp. europaea]|uniref:Transcription factor bHLH148-like n=1 Tax=Olea europaea subsp. europaea TaxID=158383 RepID=A0A8S0RB59_OLEEU|nr:transcription factor bHLH148-like [Olea europaea subsp. europaea]